MTTVYVQQNLDGEWINDSAYKAARGFYERGAEVLPFHYDAMVGGEVPLTRETIVFGGVSAVKTALEQLDIQPPTVMDYPHCMRRGFMETVPVEKTLAQITEQLQRPGFSPVFIKPSRQHKLFTGLVIGGIEDILKVVGVPEDTKVWVMRPITYVSEYRVFIHHGKIVGMSHYKGDPLVFPDVHRVKKMVTRAKAIQAVAFSLDVGVASFPARPEPIQNPTLLVEMNDAYALGSYGLPQWKYVQMIEDRWNQMTRLKES